MTRKRSLPIQHKDGRIVKHKVRSDRVHEYGKIRVGRRVAYVHKASEVRALEIVRGQGKGRRRIRLMVSESYKKREGKDRKASLAEAFITITLPSDAVDDFKEDLAREMEQQGAALWPMTIEFDVLQDESVNAVEGVEEATVFLNHRRNDTMTNILRDDIVEPMVRRYEGKGAEAAPRGEAARILRAQYDPLVGRWRDPVTGWFTLSPEAVR